MGVDRCKQLETGAKNSLIYKAIFNAYTYLHVYFEYIQNGSMILTHAIRYVPK